MKNVLTALNNIDISNHFNMYPSRLTVVGLDIISQQDLWVRLKDEEDLSKIDAIIIRDGLVGVFSKIEMIEKLKENFEGDVVVLLEEPADSRYMRRLRKLKIDKVFDMEDITVEEIIDKIAGHIAKDESEVVEIDQGIQKVYIQKQIIPILGCGGVGKTTITLNLAHLLAKENYNVCIVDANTSKPDIAMIEGVEERGFDMLLKKPVTSESIKDCVSYKSKIAYFTGLTELKKMKEVSPKINRVIKVLSKMFDVLLLDTGEMTSQDTYECIEQSTAQIFIINRSDRVVRATKRFLDVYRNTMLFDFEAVAFINNSIDTGLTNGNIKEVLNLDVVGSIKHNRTNYHNCEKGKPLSKKEDVKELKKLENKLFIYKPKKAKKGLFGRFR